MQRFSLHAPLRIANGVLILSVFLLTMNNCSSQNGFFGANRNRGVESKGILDIPVTLHRQIPQSLNLEMESEDLNLVSTGSNLQISVSGCASGYSISTTAINSGSVKLYSFDRNCLVRLESFTLGSTTYSTTGSNVVNFTTWLAGNIATFQSTTSSTDLIKVYVNTQVTQAGVQSTDTVSYNFTDLTSATTKNILQANVSAPIPISAAGQPAPNFTMTQARYLSTNSNGSANMSFTLQCGTSLTGSSLSTYACSSDVLQTQIDYIFIPDAYSQGTITAAQANAAFGANTPTSIGSLIVAPNGNDLNGNALTNGGFYTSNSSPLRTSPSEYNNLNNVFMIRRKDTNSNTLSYLYFYVNITGIAQNVTVSACGSTFAGGSGTPLDPYQVNSRTFLSNVGACNSSGTYFVQTQNIDLGGSSNPWTPINLWGQYNGAGFTISNLYININGSSNTHFGLFADIQTGSSISNLTLSNASVTVSGSTPAVGTLVGQIDGTASVTNVSASGAASLTVTGSNGWLGGLIGILAGGSVSSSSSSVNLTMNPGTFTKGGGAGGLIAFVVTNGGSCSVTNSYATGNISTPGGSITGAGQPYVSGSLIGFAFGGFGTSILNITNSYGTGNQTLAITSPDTSSIITIGGIGYADLTHVLIAGVFSSGSYSITGNNNTNILMGGFIGDLIGSGGGGSISNSYTTATLSVSGTHASNIGSVGGFIGNSSPSSSGAVTISNTYAANPSITASGVANNQGFIGFESVAPTVSNSYYYFNANTPSNVYTTGVTSYTTTTQMQTQSNFTGFTFGTDASVQNWAMPSVNPLAPNGLLSPVQYWQCASNGIVCP